MKFTDEQIAFIIHQREVSKRAYDEIAGKFSKKFQLEIEELEIKKAYHKYKNSFDKEDYHIKKLKDIARIKKSNAYTAKENRAILQALNDWDDILGAVKSAAKEVGKKKVKTKKKPIKSKKKKGMTKELLLSDIHFGKLTEKFNLKVLKERLDEVVHATIREIERDSKEYNIDEIVIAFLGDIIENYSMHVLESAKGCEFGNAQQVYQALKTLFSSVIMPLSELNIPMRVVGVTGNHDRDGTQRTMHNPGEENFTYVIYNAIKDFCEVAGLRNINFIIPKEPWAVIEIYGNKVLYEHYDNCKSPDRKALEAHLTKRSHQLNAIIDYMRGGHFHEPTSFKNGRIQINGCLTGNDSFASVLGFNGEASQTLNSFVNSKNRRYKMYRSFNILLEY